MEEGKEGDDIPDTVPGGVREVFGGGVEGFREEGDKEESIRELKSEKVSARWGWVGGWRVNWEVAMGGDLLEGFFRRAEGEVEATRLEKEGVDFFFSVNPTKDFRRFFLNFPALLIKKKKKRKEKKGK